GKWIRSFSSLRELQDVHSGVGAVDDVDIAAVVDVDVVGLDGDLAALAAVGRLDAALVGPVGGGRDVIADLARMKRIADVDRAHAGVEPGHEESAPGIHGRLVFVDGMRAEAPAAAAEAAARSLAGFGHVERGDTDRQLLVGDV